MAVSTTTEHDGAVFVFVAERGVRDREQRERVDLRGRAGRGVGAVLPGWSAAQLAAEAGEHDGESFVEFGGAVVGGQDGGEGAQPGKLGDGQPVQPEAE